MFEEIKPYRVHVNKEVCENCGDCGIKANGCGAIWKDDTWLGDKVEINQQDCEMDLSCAKGECPSYICVTLKNPENPFRKPDLDSLESLVSNIENPIRNISDKVFNIYAVGIGGWGGVTMGEILARACQHDGKYILKQDDSGLSQRGGMVMTNIKISKNKIEEGFKVGDGAADIYLCSDILGAANENNLKKASYQRTTSLVNTKKVPTRATVFGLDEFPNMPDLLNKVRHGSRITKIADATQIVEDLFNNHKLTNTFMLGLAFQSVKDFPIENASSIEKAIMENNVAVRENLLAFNFGRMYERDQKKLRMALVYREQNNPPSYEIKNREQVDDLLKDIKLPISKLERQVDELIRFQNTSYARKFLEVVKNSLEKERKFENGRNHNLTTTIADNLYDLMAYKDEYRVADLATRKEELDQIKNQYSEGNIEEIDLMLKPPILQEMPIVKNYFANGKKLPIPPSFLSAYKHLKFLRNTPLNYIFGSGGTKIRKLERKAINDYLERVDDVLFNLDSTNYSQACKALSYPSLATGYEHVKLANIEKSEKFYEEQIAEFYSK